MIATCRKLLKQGLPPRAFQYVRSCWWHSRFYVPHLTGSLFIKRAPKIHSFRGEHNSELVQQLRSVNVFAPTEMCRIMTKHGSDKGQGWHNYTTIYSRLFGKLRDRPLRILELGLGTDNPDLASSMKVNGVPGASLRGWREFFPHALVYGADIDRDILFEEDRIRTFYCDQLDAAAIRALWSQPVLIEALDIILDDGLHTFEANVSFLNESLAHLRVGGVFVVEDILHETIERWREQLTVFYSRSFPNYEFVFLELPNSSNHHDNNLLVIQRHK
jgi:hypothetical protein